MMNIGVKVLITKQIMWNSKQKPKKAGNNKHEQPTLKLDKNQIIKIHTQKKRMFETKKKKNETKKKECLKQKKKNVWNKKAQNQFWQSPGQSFLGVKWEINVAETNKNKLLVKQLPYADWNMKQLEGGGS